jgi:hypothetical protein
MSLSKHTFNGKKGETVLLSFNNIRIEGDYIKWDAFDFYTPVGDLTDDDGHKYFTVPETQIDIARDPLLDYQVFVIVRISGIEVIKVYEGEEPEKFHVDLEGLIAIDGVIPSDTNSEVILNYYEVDNAG